MATGNQDNGKNNGGMPRIGLNHRWILPVMALVAIAIIIAGSFAFAFHPFQSSMES